MTVDSGPEGTNNKVFDAVAVDITGTADCAAAETFCIGAVEGETILTVELGKIDAGGEFLIAKDDLTFACGIDVIGVGTERANYDIVNFVAVDISGFADSNS
ncbi:hypothetical protein [Microcoleus anatoxicus]|uniref:Uncharacterized protein n=1 Tax=Microcoleus anatoxicus PTRS2 TaxID=2705321 RepID=A0ABU8YTD0_9CYAN